MWTPLKKVRPRSLVKAKKKEVKKKTHSKGRGRACHHHLTSTRPPLLCKPHTAWAIPLSFAFCQLAALMLRRPTNDSDFVLMDFGLAAQLPEAHGLDPGASALSSRGRLFTECGTPAYVAPEVSFALPLRRPRSPSFLLSLFVL